MDYQTLSLTTPKQLDQLRTNLARQKLIALVIGMDAVALKHSISEPSSS
jgi:hypothetical protein